MRQTIVVVGLLAALAAVWTNDGNDDSEPAVDTDVTSSRSVEYHLTGSASGADLTWRDGRGQLAQATGKAVPLAAVDGSPGGISFQAPSGGFLYFSAQNTGGYGSLTCEILVDGGVVATNTSDGGYSIVTCQATA